MLKFYASITGERELYAYVNGDGATIYMLEDGEEVFSAYFNAGDLNMILGMLKEMMNTEGMLAALGEDEIC